MSASARPWTAGVLLGFLGMLGFSGTLVATRVAVADLSPLAITSARIVIAALLGAAYLLWVARTAPPSLKQTVSLGIMGLGLAVGYPFFLALALQSVPAVHGSVVAGLAPAATAIIAVIRMGERPPIAFWIACTAGFTAVLYYAYEAGGGHLSLADGWLVLAVLSVGIAYVEGARVSIELGGPVALSWAMILLAPASVLVLWWSASDLDLSDVSTASWAALAYLGIVSMFLASVFWYSGLAVGGAARIGQINLLLPLAALLWAALFLGESVSQTALICAVIVSGAMAVCVRSRERAK